MKTWRFVDSGALSPALNMAIDRALLALHANGKSPPTLRLYQWTPPAVSLGYFQKRHDLDLEACQRLGFEVVRRPTGGRAVLHLHDLTYAVIAGTADGLPAVVTAAYRLISEGLLAGFRLLGIRAQMGQETRNSPRTDICFLHPTLGAIVHHGKKLVGSAQTWHASSLLQHGSIMLAPQTAAWLRLTAGTFLGRAGLQTALSAGMTSVAEILGRPAAPEEVGAAMRQGLAQVLGVNFREGELTRGEQALAEEIVCQERSYHPCPTRISPRFLWEGSRSASPA